MMRILLNGACGHMGREVAALCAGSARYEIVGKVDCMASEEGVCRAPDEFTGSADVIIDFSNHLATASLLDYAVAHKIPVVIATTGHTDAELQAIAGAAAQIPVFHAANMSLGVALLVELAMKTAAVMPDADIEIVETHHNRKLDAPSGTALMIAKAIQKVRSKAFLKLGRSGNAKREKDEIGISSVRRGNVVGIHEVLVSTESQTVTLKHEAHSRALFAEGALSAADFILGKKPGLYDMNRIVHPEEA